MSHTPILRVPTVEEIAAEIRRKLPPVYDIEKDADPYGFFHDEVYVPFGWDLLPPPYEAWKEPQA